MKKTKTTTTIELTRLLDLHQRHTMKREWHESIVHHITGTLGIYHLKILTLLKEEFGCSEKARRFLIEVEGSEYSLLLPR